VDWFAYVDADVNPKASGTAPPNPDWVASGFGVTVNHCFDPDSSAKDFFSCHGRSTPHKIWGSLTAKIGELQNRLYSENLYYQTENLAETVFFPLTMEWDHTGSFPIYGSLTAGIQGQQQAGSGRPPASQLPKGTLYSVPGSYSFGRWDVYAYPCGMLPLICEQFNVNKQSFALHADEHYVNQGGGKLKEVGMSFQITPHIGATISWSSGIQDPLVYFGVVPRPINATQTSLKLQVK
jgi:hypothetical protein